MKCDAKIFCLVAIVTTLGKLFAVDQILFAKVPQVSVLSISKDIVFGDLVPHQDGSTISIVEDATSYYSITNNVGSSGKITARLTNSPKGLSIFATLTPPPGAVGQQSILLSQADQDLVSGLGKGCFSENRIHYRVIADLEAVSALANFNTLISYTLINSGS